MWYYLCSAVFTNTRSVVILYTAGRNNTQLPQNLLSLYECEEGKNVHDIVRMYSHTYSKSNIDQPGKVANPARGQLNREN